MNVSVLLGVGVGVGVCTTRGLATKWAFSFLFMLPMPSFPLLYEKMTGKGMQPLALGHIIFILLIVSFFSASETPVGIKTIQTAH